MSRTKKNKPGRAQREKRKREAEEAAAAAGAPQVQNQATEDPATTESSGKTPQNGQVEVNISRNQRKKRKREEDVESDLTIRKKPALDVPAKSGAREQPHIDDAIAHMDGSLLADHFAKKTKQHFGDLSPVELDDKYLPAKAFLDTSSVDRSGKLDDLPSFLEKFSSGGKDALRTTVAETSSPHTLFVSPSGIRAADVTRSLRVFQSDDAAVSKLFAKHIKIAESVEYVKKTRIGIGIGTPARLEDLVDLDALKTTNLRRIVIDGSYLDQKKRSIFDMEELFVPLLDLLSRPELKGRYGRGDKDALEILVF